ncbi:hypothetical protein FIBSPDRAFT_1044453 [Athelia psychrophila]|uniref:Uncharacterized protein n=1 Tax=Athelia psychrophila TaxID=1759441 RepID=A0A166JPW8_9AGAM|nr:hypothetical protein FIBSPDRAFT_1044453 [Fibularhizoctonia sp. CBS 109695]
MSFIFIQFRQLLRPQQSCNHSPDIPPNPPYSHYNPPNPHAKAPNPYPNTKTKPCNPNAYHSESFLHMDDAGSSYRSERQGIFAIFGVIAAFLFGVLCIVIGVCILHHVGPINEVVLPAGPWRNYNRPSVHAPYTGLITFLPGAHLPLEILSLLLNFGVTIFTESIGFVHSVALKSTLASEAQLAFNTSPRLFSLMHVSRWRHPNGPLFNAAMGALLTLSYSASSICIIPALSLASNDGSAPKYWSACVFGVPVIVLGTTILLQAIIAAYSIVSVKVLTWSSSPFDTTTALLRNGLITRRTGRSMHTVVDKDDALPPTRRQQPTAWQSHPVVWKVIIGLWLLCFACIVWGGWVYAVWLISPSDGSTYATTLSAWSLFPNNQTTTWAYNFEVDPIQGMGTAWPLIFGLFVAFQGSLTFGLHCAELNVNIIRDEWQWRRATTSSGMVMSRNPLVSALGSWPNVLLLVAKPTLHWLFGQAMNVNARAYPLGSALLSINLVNCPIQIWNLAVALIIVTIGMTFLAFYRPRGLQPVTFGHIQTLADVIDVWAPRIWWGYKVTNESIGHAGTSDWPLPPMDFGPTRIV